MLNYRNQALVLAHGRHSPFTFFLDEKSNKKIKTICQPGFFAWMPKWFIPLTKNPGSHQIVVRRRTGRDVAECLS